MRHRPASPCETRIRRKKYQLTEGNLAYFGGSLKSHAKFQSDVYKSRALSLPPPSCVPSRFGACFETPLYRGQRTRVPGNGPFPQSSSSPSLSPLSEYAYKRMYNVWTNVCVYTLCVPEPETRLNLQG